MILIFINANFYKLYNREGVNMQEIKSTAILILGAVLLIIISILDYKKLFKY